MRVGLNPQKDVAHQASGYFHQVIVPVYIPNLDGYFADAMKILTNCINSLFQSTHKHTFISIINNGSCDEVSEYLIQLFNDKHIHELVHTENIGKLNAILKGISGNNIPLVTICDADTLFVNGWQQETVTIFNEIRNAGVVGLVPQMTMFRHFSGNALFDNFFNDKLKFIPIPDPEAMIRFYDSIGWDRNYNLNHTKYALALDYDKVKVLVGSGHFVSTYRKDIFEEMKSYFNFKLGGDSEQYLDMQPLIKDYWRLTTVRNYAYHMGNVAEDWMEDLISSEGSATNTPIEPINYIRRKPIGGIMYFFKNRLFVKFMKFRPAYEWFLRFKKLPSEVIKNY